MESNWLFFNDLKDTNLYRTDADRSASVADGEKVGDIDDVVLDLQTGRVVFYQLGSGGFLGMGEDKIALPPQAVSFRKDGGILRVDKDRIHQAPKANTEKTTRIDANYINEVYRHYGYKPL